MRGGGVLLAVNNIYKYEPISTDFISNIEHIFVLLNVNILNSYYVVFTSFIIFLVIYTLNSVNMMKTLYIYTLILIFNL
jgi:hypothetical protein